MPGTRGSHTSGLSGLIMSLHGGRIVTPIRDITPDDVRVWALWIADPFRDDEWPPIVQLWRDRIAFMPPGDERAGFLRDYHECVTEVLIRYLRPSVRHG